MKIGFIGTGKIASAIVEGLCTSSIPFPKIFLSPRNSDVSATLAARYNCVQRMKSNQQVLDHADVIFLSLTPAHVKEVLAELVFNNHHILISLIPRITYGELLAAATGANHICRAIPLPSVSVHNCPVPLYHPNKIVIDLFECIGQPLVVNSEQELHVLWSLTGLISPFYDQLKVLSEWTVQHGVEKTIANRYIANLYQSLAFMAQQAGAIDFKEFSQHAATPNGMNEQAAKELDGHHAHQLYTTVSDNLLKRFNK